MPQSDIRTGFGLDTRDFAKFSKALRKSEADLAKEMQLGLRSAGGMVAQVAQANAEDASHTIPPSIRVRVSSATVSVVAGGAGFPLAGPMEQGNRGSSDDSRFRHPIFGRWVRDKGFQPTHPYLRPAVEESGPAGQKAIVDVLDLVVARIAIDTEA